MFTLFFYHALLPILLELYFLITLTYHTSISYVEQLK